LLLATLTGVGGLFAGLAGGATRRGAAPAVRMQQATQGPPYVGPRTSPLLDVVSCPDDMKAFTIKELKQLAYELRWETITAVSKTGGHLGSSLGVIELTVALHYVFNAPDDPICWDVSHQVYPHKILTGRRDRMNTLRQAGGLSGFAKMKESEYDAFGAGHSTTSISAALGMATAFELRGLKERNSVAVIGDGAITGGMAYEAMNNAAYLNSRVIVIYNDNGQVSLPTGTPSAGGTGPAGSLSAYTARLIASKPFQNFRDTAKTINKFFPREIQEANAKIDEYARGMVSGGTLFEELGFYYIGPVDGHDLDNLVPILESIRDRGGSQPVLLHIKTQKGFGYPPAEAASDKYHGVPKFDVATGKKQASPSKAISYTAVFAETLIDIAAVDRTVVAITAAMPGGTGVDKFGRRFPRRTFDVGIAEQHAVTFAAGQAAEGLKPFCAIYSTFLQRAYDQVIHDCALQALPVRFILDRAGLVGNDGPTHHGNYDLAYLGCIPGLAICAPSDEVELQNMIQTVYEMDSMPSALRYPRGSALGIDKLNDLFDYGLSEMPSKGTALPVGKGRIVREPRDGATKKVAILSIGTRLAAAVTSARALEADDDKVGVTVADARWMKPIDTALVDELAAEHDILITVEEGSIGGFGDHVLHYLALAGFLDSGDLKVRPMVLPDKYIEAAGQGEQYEEAGLSARFIENTARKLLGKQTVVAVADIEPEAPTIA